MHILTDFIGANATIEYNGDNVVVIPDMRDSACNWFYWAFCVTDAAGKTDKTKGGRKRTCIHKEKKHEEHVSAGDCAERI